MRNDYSYTATGAGGRLGPIFPVFVRDKQLRGIKKEAAALFFHFETLHVAISFLLCFNEKFYESVLCKTNFNFCVFFSLVLSDRWTQQLRP